MKHTPTPATLPWNVSICPGEDCHIVDASGESVCENETPEHAAFIVRAANSHAALVEALRNLTNYVDTYKYGSAWAGRPHNLCDAARAALKSAE